MLLQLTSSNITNERTDHCELFIDALLLLADIRIESCYVVGVLNQEQLFQNVSSPHLLVVISVHTIPGNSGAVVE